MSTIEELKLLDCSSKTLFDSNDRYIIPLYQRAYSWSDKEIEQLIDDLLGFVGDQYYLGSLIVYKRTNGYEIIDGQQRLTTLYILFDVLKHFFSSNDCNNYQSLSFECRKKSNYTLLHYFDKSFSDSLIEKEIIDAKDIIYQKLKREKIDASSFLARLSKVIIYRIEVPKYTNLNRYFEIMNTRGEQLEQTDILKAELMTPLNECERDSFATIWNACSDMTGYVQMHFKEEQRSKLFSPNWGEFNEIELNRYITSSHTSNLRNKDLTIKEAMLSNKIKTGEESDKDMDRIRFTSIINFPYFLLHVLIIYVHSEGIISNDGKDILHGQLDDMNLLSEFERVVKVGMIGNNKIDLHDFSLSFLKCLIKCRFLFDKYIVKRDCPTKDSSEEWSIKELKSSGKLKKKTAYYTDTIFRHSSEHEQTHAARNKKNVMIQSCLRVSYTSPKTMHWITKLLEVLYKDSMKNDMQDFYAFTENIARDSIKAFYKLHESDKYKLGVNTPHIVFNYLDYLLWKEDSHNKFKNFEFAFRNSVEHWYPQNPSKDTFGKWDDVDTFGNLCIIQREQNSRFSNKSPISKKNDHKKMIENGSLKLRLMAEKTDSDDNWEKNACHEHEKRMTNILEKDIYNSYFNGRD